MRALHGHLLLRSVETRPPEIRKHHCNDGDLASYYTRSSVVAASREEKIEWGLRQRSPGGPRVQQQQLAGTGIRAIDTTETT